jgi:VWFA-related protein
MRPVIFSAFVCAAATIYGQSSSGQQNLRTTTAGVLIDVTVADAKGQPVLDIAPAEFEISEDGVRQQILSVSLVQRGVARPLSLAPAEPAAVQPPAAGAIAPTPAATPETIPSVTAILFDGLSAETRPLARKAALAYVSTLTPPQDYAGVFLADVALKTFQSFTNKQESLALAVDRVAGTAAANMSPVSVQESPRIQGMDPNQAPTIGAESGGGFLNALDRERRLKELGGAEEVMARMELRMREGYVQFLAEFDGQSSLAGLRAVVSSLAALPGRKSILYFTEDLPITSRLKPKFDALIGEANRANVTVYTVDAVGLRVHSGEAAVARNVGVAGTQGLGDVKRDDGPWTKELERQEQILSSRATAVLGRLAKETGGFLLENTNNLGAGVARMQQERTTYYLVAYQPTNAKSDGKFRRVSVKVKRPKVNVKARPGYVAAPA